ncbi:MAG: phosphodiester glycosidase family protein [Bacillota bacterium]|nr:phosphodiester glycosidase family protein [Bacillota bacterium]
MKKTALIIITAAMTLLAANSDIVAQSIQGKTLTSVAQEVIPQQTASSDKEQQKAVETKEVAPGVDYTVFRDKQNLLGESLRVHVLAIDINQRDLEILPVYGGSKLGDSQTVGDMAKKHGAVAAINGGFFGNVNGRALPVGNLVIDGKPIATSDYYRTSVSFSDKEGIEGLQVLMGYFNPTVEIILPQGKQKISSTNSGSTAPGIHLYTSEWGSQLAGATDTVNVVLTKAGADNYWVSDISEGNIVIPSEGIVLRFIGESQRTIANRLALGYPTKVQYIYDQNLWGNINHLITAGPMLVEQGEAVFQAIQEGFTGSLLDPNPRSALGVTKEGNVLFVVAERATGSGRVGLTLEEMALLMVELGAVSAVGLDGGGSSTMYVKDGVVNNAASSQRSVANGFMVLIGPKLFLNGDRIFPDTPPVITGNRTLVPIRVIMEALGASVNWDQATKTVTINKGQDTIKLVIGSNRAEVNGQEMLMDVAPEVHGHRTMIPIRFITENLKGAVDWDPTTRSINIRINK